MHRSGIVTVSMSFLIVCLMMGGSIDNAHAQAALGVKLGTTGIGAEGSIPVYGDNLNARVGGTFFSYDHSGVYEDDDPSIAYDASLSITSVGAVVDYFPFRNHLKVSGGVFYYDFSVDGGARPNEAYTIEDKTFQPEKMGSLSADAGFGSNIVPYASIGLGDPLHSDHPLTFNVELGALYTDSPHITMDGKGMISATADQAQNFEEGVSDFTFYPVLNVGLSYRILSR